MTPAADTSGSRPGAPEDADLLDYALLGQVAAFALRAPLRHKLIAASCVLVMVTVSIGALRILPKRYQVQAAVLALPNPLSLEFNQFDAPTRAAKELVMQRDNLVLLLKQTDFAARHAAARSPAGRAREWIRRELGRPEPTPEQVIEDLADSLEERLQVWVSSAGTITFKFEWSNRELARDVVEAAIRSFLETRHASDVARVEEAISILEDHATRLNAEVVAKAEQLKELERTVRSPAAEDVRPSPPPAPELVTLRRQLTAKRRALAAVEEYRQRQAMELQVQLLQQEQIYAEQHPALTATRRTIEALSGPSPRVQGLRTEIADLEREMRLHGAGPGELGRSSPASATAGEDPKLEFERSNLWLLVRQHSGLLERIDMARVDLDTARAGFKYRYSVITPPQMPKGAIKPNAAKVLAMGLVAGALLALFATVAVDLASGRVLERWQVERRLGVPVLAELGDAP